MVDIAKAGNDFFDNLMDSVNRRIDNEISGEYRGYPSPGGASPLDQSVIKTADNEQGSAKVAGTGDRWFSSVDNKMVIIGAGALGVAALFWALK